MLKAWMLLKSLPTIIFADAGDPIDDKGLDAAGVIYFANCVPSVASILSAALLYTVNSQNALANYH
jgi:hypothetical protein